MYYLKSLSSLFCGPENIIIIINCFNKYIYIFFCNNIYFIAQQLGSRFVNQMQSNIISY